MKTQIINKSIEINAPKEKVWDVLIMNKYTSQWYSAFGDGLPANTDWKVGSKAVFTDKSGNGMVSKIVKNKPGEILSLEYAGVVENGQEIYDTAHAKDWVGGHETYRLSEKNGVTRFDLEQDMASEYYDDMSKAWDTALQKVKQLAEGKAPLA
ncbi:MAG TPA: SRPBCC domain-containing protein [Bacillota bacterium]|nr:SRPBCC domain-containing protein [Bacillota bacterium]